MYEIIKNEIVRNNISTIPYMWIRSKKPNKSLCVLLPGLGYTTQQPLFHYATNVLADNEIDILHINYTFENNEHFARLSKTEKEQWMYEDIRAVVDNVWLHTEYEQCFLLSKSIGTVPMAIEWTQKSFIQQPFGIWLTPLINENKVYQALLNTDFPSLIVIGDQDQHYQEDRISSLKSNAQVSTLIIPNANHSLEVNGDITATIDVMKVIMKRVQEFIKFGNHLDI